LFKYKTYWNEKKELKNLIGQSAIHKKLETLAELFLQGENVNILLNARTGLGKTTFARFFVSCCQDNKKEQWVNWIPSKDNQSISEYLSRKENKDTRLIFIDECHLIEDPEWIYPFLDKKEKTFILATNELGKLKAPLKNGRLLTLSFEEYTDDELIQMANDSLLDMYKDNPFLPKIIKAGKRNPRKIVHSICYQINQFAKLVGEMKTDEQFNQIMDFLGYDKNGFDSMERSYLNFLRSSGKAGLNTITSATGLSRETIVNDIEPDLLAQKIVLIGSGGRIYNGE